MAEGTLPGPDSLAESLADDDCVRELEQMQRERDTALAETQLLRQEMRARTQERNETAKELVALMDRLEADKAELLADKAALEREKWELIEASQRVRI